MPESTDHGPVPHMPPLVHRVINLASEARVMVYVLLNTGQTVIGNDWTAESDGTVSVSPWLDPDGEGGTEQPMWLDPATIVAVYIPPAEDNPDAPWLVKR